MAPRTGRKFYLADLIALVALCGLVSALVAGSRQGRQDAQPFVLAMILVAVTWGVVRSRRGTTACEACGRRFTPVDPSDLERALCPSCLALRKKPDPEVVIGQPVRIRGVFVFLLVASAMTVYFLAPKKPGAAGVDRGGPSSPWPIAIVAVAGAVLGFLAIRRKAGAKLLSREGLLEAARRSEGEAGTIVEEGPIRIWYPGEANPAPMIREAIAEARDRFASLLGEDPGDDPPLQILAFRDREALRALYRESFPGVDLSSHIGIYLKQPFGVLFLVATEVPGRIDDPRTLFGSLFDGVLIERIYGRLPVPWVEMGVTRALTARVRPGTLGRLNRRMIAAIEGGSAWSERIFAIGDAEAGKMLSRPDDPALSRKAEEMGEQSWSIVEYHLGESAPDARREAFRAFLKDRRSRSDPAASYFRHFGHGLSSMLESWREWVREQGVGPDGPPPPWLRGAIEQRLLPVIRDPSAPVRDRVQAIRDWRAAGYTIGAGALIDLLRAPGEIPTEGIVWALQSASGTAWGDEPDRWRAWYDTLPDIARASADV